MPTRLYLAVVLFTLFLASCEAFFSGNRILFRPIGTPSQLLDSGYTPDSVALSLIGEIHNIRDATQATTLYHADPVIQATRAVPEGPEGEASRTTVLTGADESGLDIIAGLSPSMEDSGPDLVVPAVGLSIKSTAAYLRDFFVLSRRVGGELISVASSNDFVLQLRIDGRRIPTPCALGRKGTVSQVLYYGAREILCVTQPLTLAAYDYVTRDLVRIPQLIFLARINGGAQIEAPALVLEGRLAALDGRLDDAIQKYAQALDLNPRFVHAHHSWGNALLLQEKYQEAAQQYQQAVIRDSTFTPAYLGWGRALYLDNDYVGAITKYSHAVERGPTSVWAYYYWGNALRANKNYGEAIEKFEQALMLDSTFAPAYLGWGNTLYVQREYVAAIKQYVRALKHRPDYSHAYFNWGNVLRALECYRDARDKYTLALKYSIVASPLHNRIASNLSEILFHIVAMDEEAVANEKSQCSRPGTPRGA